MQSVYAALGIHHAVMRYVDRDDIATPSTVLVRNSHTWRCFALLIGAEYRWLMESTKRCCLTAGG